MNNGYIGKTYIGLAILSLLFYWLSPYQTLSTIAFWFSVIMAILWYKRRKSRANHKTHEQSEQKTDQEQGHAETKSYTAESEDDIRTLYRKALHKYHPDFARSDEDKRFRTELTAKLNRAYQEGEVATLRLFL